MFEFLVATSCKHDKITPHMKSGYCPDCGDYVENSWYISRCKCCGIKQNSFVRNGKIIPDAKFCKNCGSNSFYLEKLDDLDIVNIHYAVILKHVIQSKRKSIIQTWIDQSSYSPIKLLPSY